MPGRQDKFAELTQLVTTLPSLSPFFQVSVTDLVQSRIGLYPLLARSCFHPRPKSLQEPNQ